MNIDYDWINFQSTLPGRGATSCTFDAALLNATFNPRSPGGERPCFFIQDGRQEDFQSTLPGRGATTTSRRICSPCSIFQSTLPGRGATRAIVSVTMPFDLSIHAPRAGSDGANPGERQAISPFNPRSPGGERPPPPFRLGQASAFNPRSPGGERQRRHRRWPRV